MIQNKKHLFLFMIFVFYLVPCNAQWYTKEFSKDIALYKAKAYLFMDVLGSTPDVTKFEVIPLAAASSGELTTLLYKCESKQKEGLVLGFMATIGTNRASCIKGLHLSILTRMPL